MNISKEANDKVIELINEGWQFYLHYGELEDNSPFVWEADFTKRLGKDEKGLWDNHESGISETSVSEAIINAYSNIRNGIRL